jgi:hypothetical protein
LLDQEGCRDRTKIVTGLEIKIYRAETRELQVWSKSVVELDREGYRAGAKEDWSKS